MKKILSIAAAGLAALFGFNAQAEDASMTMTGKKVLVVYFSRTGEQYGVGNISKGNTEIIAEMIAGKTNGDLFEVKLQHDNYPAGYTPLTKVAKTEKQANARPEIIGDVADFDKYDVVFVGGPVWWGDLPMPVYTFIEKHDWSGKTVVPFCTHEGSGLADIPENLEAATGAKTLEGLAVYGHVAQNERADADKKVSAWLKKLGF